MNCPVCDNDECELISEEIVDGKDNSSENGCCDALCTGICGLNSGNSETKTVRYWYCEECGSKFKE
ncbi:MAG: hypothetical protein K6G26_07995 [Lachnospiraceae bacterium]|nr:hypothetical protein [Lachnospiraceae bacterium]